MINGFVDEILHKILKNLDIRSIILISNSVKKIKKLEYYKHLYPLFIKNNFIENEEGLNELKSCILDLKNTYEYTLLEYLRDLKYSIKRMNNYNYRHYNYGLYKNFKKKRTIMFNYKEDIKENNIKKKIGNYKVHHTYNIPISSYRYLKKHKRNILALIY